MTIIEGIGKAEAGDHFGWTIAVAPDSVTGEEQSDSIVIGDPGEDVKGVGTNSGYVYLVKGRGTSSSALVPVGGLKAGLGYGTVLGSPQDGSFS